MLFLDWLYKLTQELEPEQMLRLVERRVQQQFVPVVPCVTGCVGGGDE